MSRGTEGTDGRAVSSTGRLAAGAAAALLSLPLLAGPAGAQDADRDPDEPPMADAPNQFRVSAAGGWVGWSEPDAAGEQRIAGAAAWGLDLETRVSRYVAFRLGAAYGRTTITGSDGDGPTREVDANQLLLELVAETRLSLGTLRRAGVVPFGTVGLGSVVHDPSAEPGEFDPSLATRSQGSVVYGGGVEVEPSAVESLGLRLEWRRADVRVQNLFVAAAREGTSRISNRLLGTLYWSF